MFGRLSSVSAAMSGKGTWVSDEEDERRRVVWERLVETCERQRARTASCLWRLEQAANSETLAECHRRVAQARACLTDAVELRPSSWAGMKAVPKGEGKGKDKGKGKDGEVRARSRSPQPAWVRNLTQPVAPPSPQTPPE